MMSLDTETTGTDFHHGARPFFVTMCYADGEQHFLEWNVDPLSREVLSSKEDLVQITEVIDSAELIIGQNLRFDVKALGCLLKDHGIQWQFPWCKAADTLVAGHLLASAMPHDLTSMALHWLGKRGDIKHLEDALEKAVKASRAVARRDHPNWAIARKGRSDMPSARDETWAFDCWLPRALALANGCSDHGRSSNPDLSALRNYANADSAVTLLLWQAMEADLKERKLWDIYLHQMDVARVIPRMEGVGVTFSRKRLKQLKDENETSRAEAEQQCLAVAEEHGWELEIPKAGNNGSLKTFCFGAVGPKIVSGGQTGVDQAALQAAKDSGLETGGTAPKGWKTTAGSQPLLKKFGLKQSRSDQYADRTLQNVEDADGTLQVFIDPKSPGERCTLKAVDQLRKPLHHVDMNCLTNGSIDKAAEFVARLKVVNVAGNSERTCPGIQEKARDFLMKVFAKAKRPLLNLPVVKRTETGQPSLDKDAFDIYLATLEGQQLNFVKALKNLRKRSTALSYLESYEKFGVNDGPGWSRLFPSLNQTGTATLRFSSSAPNSQQISKQEDGCEPCEGKGTLDDGAACEHCRGTGIERTSLRHVFGPGPGREWWSLDFENVELRIPAYESGERKMIELFERPDEPPYFGSYHLLNASIVYPDLFWPLAEQKGEFKRRYGDKWYQWIKNFDFALQYSCGEATGDRAAHKVGAWKSVKSELACLEALNQRCIRHAEKHGCVETIPDKTIDPNRGYPVMTSRSEWGRISPTLPLAYYVSSTAMQCTRKSMVRCQDQLDQWRADEGFDGHAILQVHDEMVFDFPKGKHVKKAMRLKALMECSGQDIGIPLSVAATWNPQTWGRGQPY